MAVARVLPLKRKIEEAFAGFLLDAQKADPTVLPGLTIVCGHTGRSPDDPEAAQVKPTEPDLPYLAVSCGKVGADPEMPPSTGIKVADLVFHLKTESNDEARALADERLSELEFILEDEAPILAALNISAVGAADGRRVQQLYVYAVNQDDQADEHNETTWIDQLSQTVTCQNFDPDDGTPAN